MVLAEAAFNSSAPVGLDLDSSSSSSRSSSSLTSTTGTEEESDWGFDLVAHDEEDVANEQNATPAAPDRTPSAAEAAAVWAIYIGNGTATYNS